MTPCIKTQNPYYAVGLSTHRKGGIASPFYFMKRALLFVLLIALYFCLVHESNSAGTKLGGGVKTTTNTSTSVPVALSSTNLWVTEVTILAKRNARTDNTGDIYLGEIDTNDEQPFKMTPGAEASFQIPSAEAINLKNWYLDVTTVNDGVVILYTVSPVQF